MRIDVSRYTLASGSLRVRGGGFMAISAAFASCTGLMVLIGLSMALNPDAVHPTENLVEGILTVVVAGVPTVLFALLFVRGLRHWSNAGAYDRLVDLARRSPGISVADAGRELGLASARLGQLVSEGATRGFIVEPEVPGVFAELGAGGAQLYAAGRTPLLAVLVSYGTGLAAFGILLTHTRGALLVGCAATVLTAALDLVAVVGGISSYRAARRAQPVESTRYPVIAVVLGALGFFGVLALAAMTVLSTF